MSRFVCPVIFGNEPFKYDSDKSHVLKYTMKRYHYQCSCIFGVCSVEQCIGVVFHFVTLDDNICYRMCYLNYLSVVFHFVKFDDTTCYRTCYLEYVSV